MLLQRDGACDEQDWWGRYRGPGAAGGEEHLGGACAYKVIKLSDGVAQKNPGLTVGNDVVLKAPPQTWILFEDSTVYYPVHVTDIAFSVYEG